MKTVIFALLFFVPLQLFAQNHITELDYASQHIYYTLSFVPDSTKPTHVVEEKMLLQVGKKVSKFVSYNRYLKDSSFIASSDPNKNISIPTLLFEVFKNHPEGKVTYLDMPLISVNLKYQIDFVPLKWQILPEKKVVLGYTCQKATTHFAGRDYVAWFTTEIPLQDAPYLFDGLPGFIVKVQDTREHYTFELQRIEKYNSDAVKIFIKNYYKEVTRQQYLETLQEIHSRDMYSIISEIGIEFSALNATEEDHRRVQKNVRWLSNYIELE